MGENDVINAESRFMLTLSFLARGETYISLYFQFRFSRAAISNIVKQVSKTISRNMQPIYLKVPSTAKEWLAIPQQFEERWQFPNCLGATDGKHLIMQPPPDACSKYYNYNITHSSILLASAGPDYECVYAHV